MKKRRLRFAIAVAGCLLSATISGDDSRTGRSTTFWGGVDYQNFGETSVNFDTQKYTQQDYDWISAQLGIDARVSNNLLAGVAISWSQSEIETVGTGDSATSHKTDTDLTGIHPYISWRAPDGKLDWWATVSNGKRSVENVTYFLWGFPNQRIYRSETNYDYYSRTAWAGASWLFLSQTDTEWRLKVEALHTRFKIDYDYQGVDCYRCKWDSHFLHMAVEARQSNFILSGAQLQPSIQASVSYSGGNQRVFDGARVEVDGVLRYQNDVRGLTLDGRAWALDGISGDHKNDKEWSIDATLRLARTGWRGLSLTLASGYGSRPALGSSSIWRTGAEGFPDRNPHAWVYARIAYNLTSHPAWTACPRMRAGC